MKRLPWRVVIPWFLTICTAAAAITFFLLWRDLDAGEAERKEAQAVASDFILALTNFSYETIDADVEEIRSFAVGDFAEEADTYFGDDGIAAIKEAQAVSEAQIESVFVQAIDEDEASIFGVVRETISNSLTPDAQTDVLRLEVGLIRTSQGWKVNRVDVFQAPGSGPVGAGPG